MYKLRVPGIVLSAFLAACFPLEVPEGLLCDTGKKCPDGMLCASDGVCYASAPICEVPGTHDLLADALADDDCDTIALLADEHEESVRIDRTVTILGEGQLWLPSAAGSIVVVGAGEVVLRDLVLSAGSADQGGAIHNAATLTLDNCVIQNSTAEQGGGIYSSGALTMNGGAITGNQAAIGAGLYSVGTLSLHGTEIVDNSVSIVDVIGGGGGLYSGSGAVFLENVSVRQNSVTVAGPSPTAQGAGLWVRGGPLTITGSTISSNQTTAVASSGNASARGGGMYLEVPSGTHEAGLLESFVSANVAQIENSSGTAVGAGLAVDSSGTSSVTLLLQESELSLNETRGNNLDQAHTATLAGTVHGAAADSSQLTLTVKRSTVSDNRVVASPQASEQPTVSQGGGAIAGRSTNGAASFRLYVENTTISLNQVGDNALVGAAGAGIDLESTTSGAALTFEARSVTLWANSVLGATGAAGVAIRLQSAADLSGQARNSVFAGSTGGDDCGVVGGDWVGHYVLINSGSANCFDGSSTHLSNGDPQFGSLTQNGGPTRTHLPGAASAVLDAGDVSGCTSTSNGALNMDQRNFARHVGAECDLGAVERAP